MCQADAAVLLLRVPAGQQAVVLLNDGAEALPFAETRPGGSFILAFKMLPLVLVISAIGAVLFHWGCCGGCRG